MGTCLMFLFFKQKTAYEMRSSDWSSDVCSSDLRNILRVTGEDEPSGTISGARSITGGAGIVADSRREAFDNGGHYGVQEWEGTSGAVSGHPKHNNGRSEEHTSELQSLMRTSYAVFCLKKKNKNITTQLKHQTQATN